MPTIQFRTDETTKAQSVEIFQQLGITMTDAINMFLRQSILHGGLPFDLKIPKYNEARDRLHQNSTRHQRITSVKKFLADVVAIKDEDNVLADLDWNELAAIRSQTNLSRKIEI